MRKKAKVKSEDMPEGVNFKSELLKSKRKLCLPFYLFTFRRLNDECGRQFAA